MSQYSLRFLSALDIAKALSMAQAIDCTKSVFAQVTLRQVVMPPRQHFVIPERAADVLVMPSYLREGEHLGLKLITLHDRNPGQGLPRVQALVLLVDARNGQPRAVLNGSSLTALRTGAASGAATDLLARPDAHVVAILGAGVQARTQLKAVCTVRRITHARVFDPVPAAGRSFAAEMQAGIGVPVQVAASAADAVSGADVVCTATNSQEPVFSDADLAAGTHINAVGSYQPSVQEVPAETVVRACVVVDHLESALLEAGDLLVPMKRGLFSPERIHAELGEVVVGRRPGRRSTDEITLFKSVGLSAQDAAIAAQAVANAENLGLGTVVEM